MTAPDYIKTYNLFHSLVFQKKRHMGNKPSFDFTRDQVPLVNHVLGWKSYFPIFYSWKRIVDTWRRSNNTNPLKGDTSSLLARFRKCANDKDCHVSVVHSCMCKSFDRCVHTGVAGHLLLSCSRPIQNVQDQNTTVTEFEVIGLTLFDPKKILVNTWKTVFSITGFEKMKELVKNLMYHSGKRCFISLCYCWQWCWHRRWHHRRCSNMLIWIHSCTNPEQYPKKCLNCMKWVQCMVKLTLLPSFVRVRALRLCIDSGWKVLWV